MRMTLAIAIVVLGVVTVLAGGAAMWNYGVVADETGISGWNPMLWLVLFTGCVTVAVGTLQIAAAHVAGQAVRGSTNI